MRRDVDGWVPTSLPVQKFVLTPAAANFPEQIFCGITSYLDCSSGCYTRTTQCKAEPLRTRSEREVKDMWGLHGALFGKCRGQF